MSALRNLNLALAFAIEVAMLAGFAYAGWVGPSALWLKFVLAIGLPALAILLWAVWAAPKAGKLKLGEPGLTIFKVLIFGVATFLLWASQVPVLAAIFGLAAATNVIAAWVLGQVRLRP